MRFSQVTEDRDVSSPDFFCTYLPDIYFLAEGWNPSLGTGELVIALPRQYYVELEGQVVLKGMKYETKMLTPADLEEAAELLKQGECVAFPTETVYGLGANALDADAVARIFAAKGRPADNPLIIHCAEVSQFNSLVRPWGAEVQVLMDSFWPGPLTLVLAKTGLVPMIVTGGLDTVAVRVPDHPVALALLKAAKLPLAAPSANVSGRPSPTRASHVWEDLRGRIPAIVDGGPTGWGVESTVLDCTCQPFRVLRPGAVTVEQLAKIVEVALAPGGGKGVDAPRSPGLKYRHYSPLARVVLVVGNNIHPALAQMAKEYQEQGHKVGVMAFADFRDRSRDLVFLDMGSRANLQQAASRIYDLLRQADQMGCTAVLVEGLVDEHLGRTIMNRLQQAAGSNIIYT